MKTVTEISDILHLLHQDHSMIAKIFRHVTSVPVLVKQYLVHLHGAETIHQQYHNGPVILAPLLLIILRVSHHVILVLILDILLIIT